MPQFIRVIGKDPKYSSLDIDIYLAIASIRKIFPIYGIRGKNNVYDQCPPVDEEGEFLGYGMIDSKGDVYTCRDPGELEKLGIFVGQHNPQVPNYQ